jgi:site-specific recombinase XerD
MATKGRRALGLDLPQPSPVFATWALVQPGLRLEDVSRLLGHSGTRVTQDVYVHVHDDVYQRFYEATE